MSDDFKEDLYNFEQVNDKIINQFLYELKPVAHYDDEYQTKLLKIQQLQAFKIPEDSFIKILTKQPFIQPKNPQSQLCECCFEEISGRKKKWCRVCGHNVCKGCLVRKREMTNGEIIEYCELCDKQFLEAMEAKLTSDKYKKLNKAFLKLAQEQQMAQKLLSIEKNKTKQSVENEEENELMKYSKILVEKRTFNKSAKLQIMQLNRKIEWGTEVNEHLKNKERRMKKVHQASFSSSVNEDNEKLQPPKIDIQSSLSVQNLNESLINSLLQTQQQQQAAIQPRKCSLDTCSIF